MKKPVPKRRRYQQGGLVSGGQDTSTQAEQEAQFEEMQRIETAAETARQQGKTSVRVDPTTYVKDIKAKGGLVRRPVSRKRR